MRDRLPSAPTVDDAQRRVGTTLRGKWRLERLLGVGGMGAVYAARHRNGMRVAVKVLDPALARARDCRTRFLREGRLANEVDHVGAVRVLDDDETSDGSAFLVMELLEGATLEELAMTKGGTLAADEVLRYAAQVLDTLVVAHARGIIHRDIKPENLFLTRDGVVKILDFGVARMNGLGDELRVTHTGEPIGTPAFMSPEQARGQWDMVDERTDVYSVGATMFDLLTGELVHEGAKNVVELLSTIATTPARAVRQVSDVPKPVAAVVDKAVAFDKRLRWASAAEMRAAIEEAHRALVGSPVPETPAPSVPVVIVAAHPRHRARWAVAAAAVVAAGSFVVGATRADPGPPAPALARTLVSSPRPSARIVARVADPTDDLEPEPVLPAPAVSAPKRAVRESAPAWLSRESSLYQRRD